jgi:hypothetical protein
MGERNTSKNKKRNERRKRAKNKNKKGKHKYKAQLPTKQQSQQTVEQQEEQTLEEEEEQSNEVAEEEGQENEEEVEVESQVDPPMPLQAGTSGESQKTRKQKVRQRRKERKEAEMAIWHKYETLLEDLVASKKIDEIDLRWSIDGAFGLTSFERRIVHTLAKQRGLHANSHVLPSKALKSSKQSTTTKDTVSETKLSEKQKGKEPVNTQEKEEEEEEDTRKVMIVKKPPNWTPAPSTRQIASIAELPITLRLRFREDFGLPIPVIQSPYFEYFVDLYQPLFGSRDKLNLFIDAVNDQGGRPTLWRDYTDGVIKACVDDVFSNPAYRAFRNDPLKQFKGGDELDYTIYKRTNAGNYFLSLDFSAAGFNALRYYNSDIVFGCNTWEEFLGRYTKYECLLQSKKFRSVLLSKLNIRNQMKIYKSLMHQVYEKLIKARIITKTEVRSKYTDEIVIIINNKADIQRRFDTISDFLENNLPDIDFIKVEAFRLKLLSPEDYQPAYFVKEVFDNKHLHKLDVSRPVFKCVHVQHFAQVYKLYLGKEDQINEMDRTYCTPQGEKKVMPVGSLWK